MARYRKEPHAQAPRRNRITIALVGAKPYISQNRELSPVESPEPETSQGFSFPFLESPLARP